MKKRVLFIFVAVVFCWFSGNVFSSVPQWPDSISGLNGLGVSVHWRGKLDKNSAIVEPLSIEEIEKQIKPMVEMGVKIIREDIHWQWEDKDKYTYEFSKFSRLVNICDKYKMKLLVILTFVDPQYENGWSIKTENGRISYAKFCSRLAGEFKGRGIIWEMWNEPNLDGFWSPKADASEYIEAIKMAAQAMREKDPDCLIVAPSTCTFDMPFLEKCISSGLLEYISAMSIHPYCDTPETQIARYIHLKNLMAKYKPVICRDIPVVCSEWGFSRLFVGLGGNRVRSQDEQAALVVRSILVDQICGVPMHIIYTNLDYKNEEKFEWNENHFGLATVDGKPKASYQAVKTLRDQLDGLKFEKMLLGGGSDIGEVSDGTYVTVFSNGSKKVVVAWTTGNQYTAKIQVSSMPVHITDMKGKEVDFKAKDYENEQLKVTLSNEPIYVNF